MQVATMNSIFKTEFEKQRENWLRRKMKMMLSAVYLVNLAIFSGVMITFSVWQMRGKYQADSVTVTCECLSVRYAHVFSLI